MHLAELNDEIILLKELKYIEDLTSSFEFTLNESEMLDEGAIFDWIKKQSDKVSDFFDDFVQTASLATDSALAEKVGNQINSWTWKGKLKEINISLTGFIEKLKSYIQEFPSFEQILNGIVVSIEKFKSMLVVVYNYVASKSGFLKLIGAVAFSGFIAKVYEIVVKYTTFIKGFVIDAAKDTTISISASLKPILDQFLDVESFKDKLLSVVGGVVGNTSGLSSVVSLFNGASDVLKYIAGLIKAAIEKFAVVNIEPNPTQSAT